jgi:hypothetical protein
MTPGYWYITIIIIIIGTESLYREFSQLLVAVVTVQ